MSNIVHVDNSEFFRKLMKTFLSEGGHQAESFERGEDALNKVNNGSTDIVIMGLEIADMNGEDLINRLAASFPKIPVIVVTSSDDVERSEHLTGLGVKAVIGKSGNWKEELGKLLK